MTLSRTYVTEPGHVIAAAMFLSVIDITAVALRFWARYKQREKFQADDLLMLPAVILVTAIGIVMTYGVSQEALAHPTQIPPDFTGSPLELTTAQISLAYKIQWAFELMLPLALGCVKVSFLFFYLRIFLVNRKTSAGYILYSLVILISLWSVAFFFATVFQCRLNFWALWGTTLDIVNNCTETMSLVLALCISGVITDLAIIIAPIPLVWQLRMTLGRKLSIIAIFLLGSITIIASLIRLVKMARLVIIGFSPDEDGLLVVTEYLYWGIVECGVGVLAACLPTLQSLFRHWSWSPVMTSLRSIFSVTSSFRSGYAMTNEAVDTEGFSGQAPLGRPHTNQASAKSATSVSTRENWREGYPMQTVNSQYGP